MNDEEKTFKWMEPHLFKEELVRTVAMGLDRGLTHHEVSALLRICDWDYETRGIILHLFKELVHRKDAANHVCS